MSKKIAIYSMKGGVGKTAAAVNLSYLAASEGASTLLCDLDPQGASTYYFRIRASKSFNTNKFIKGGKHIDKNIKGTDFPNLNLLPSKLSYRNLDLALDALKNSKKRLKEIFKEVEYEYDYLFMDCPPGISLVSENVFNAADIILVPLIPTTLSELTYEKLLKFFKKHDKGTRKIHTFFSMVEIRKTLHQETMNKLMEEDGNILETRIPYRSDVEKMGIYREPVPVSSPHSESTQAYIKLWNEIKTLL
ncbi:MAG: AAA family ATPase [Deltaproteobacteria bacterium]|nr:AAA family ATPase [Deltaproteobacteria bacterium]